VDFRYRPRRTCLSVPGSNPTMIEKAKGLLADEVFLDLEDAVAPDAKPTARMQVTAAVSAGGFGRREVVIRVNGLGTPWIADDIAAAVAAKPDAILVPKVSSGADVAELTRMLAPAPAGLRLWAMIETPLAILNLREIAAAATAPGARLSCFVLGTNDLVKDSRAELDAARTGALYWLSATVTAARAYGLDVLDGVYNNFKDHDGFRAECRQGRGLGMDGKTLIHPDQIGPANEIFAPSDTDIAAARKIIAAFDMPENASKGVITVDGRMVEIMHRDMARRTVAIAEAIAG